MSARPSATCSRFAAVLIAAGAGLAWGAPATALSTPQEQDPPADTVARAVAANEGRFKLLTYNVAGLPPGVSKSKPLRNMVQIGPKLRPYDLVLVQEDFLFHALLTLVNDHPFRSEPKDPSRIFSKSFLQMLLAFPDLDLEALLALIDEDRITSDGLNRLSRFAFEGHERHRWERCHGFTSAANDCLATKGFTFARHELAPGSSIDVYNVHADAGRRVEDEQARAEQFAQLRAFIEERSVGHAVVVGGDTNLQSPVPADEQVIRGFMEALGLSVVARTLGQEDGVDRVFYRGGEGLDLTPLARGEAAEFVDGGGSPLSDHPAVWVEFSWRRLDTTHR